MKKEDIAAQALNHNTHLEEVFVTSDCTPFSSKNAAINHAVKLDDKSIDIFKRSAEKVIEPVEKTVYALNSKDTIRLIEAAESEDAVKHLVGTDERKTVIAAGEKQVAILKQAALTAQAAAADAAQAARQTENPNNADTSANSDEQGK